MQNSLVIYRHLQTVYLIFYSYWQSEANTHKGPSDKSLFLHKAPCVKSTPPNPLHPNYLIKKTLLKNITSLITVVIFTDICVFCFSNLVPVDPQKCCLVWYTSKHGAAHNPILRSQCLNFVLVSLSVEEHTQHQILSHWINWCLLCRVSSLV